VRRERDTSLERQRKSRYKPRKRGKEGYSERAKIKKKYRRRRKYF
jgi:hypothetical protein